MQKKLQTQFHLYVCHLETMWPYIHRLGDRMLHLKQKQKPFLYKINPTKPVLRGADLICNKTQLIFVNEYCKSKFKYLRFKAQLELDVIQLFAPYDYDPLYLDNLLQIFYKYTVLILKTLFNFCLENCRLQNNNHNFDINNTVYASKEKLF